MPATLTHAFSLTCFYRPFLLDVEQTPNLQRHKTSRHAYAQDSSQQLSQQLVNTVQEASRARHLLHTSFIDTFLANELHLQGPLQRVVGRCVLYLKQSVIHQVWAAPHLQHSKIGCCDGMLKSRVQNLNPISQQRTQLTHSSADTMARGTDK